MKSGFIDNSAPIPSKSSIQRRHNPMSRIISRLRLLTSLTNLSLGRRSGGGCVSDEHLGQPTHSQLVAKRAGLTRFLCLCLRWRRRLERKALSLSTCLLSSDSPSLLDRKVRVPRLGRFLRATWWRIPASRPFSQAEIFAKVGNSKKCTGKKNLLETQEVEIEPNGTALGAKSLIEARTSSFEEHYWLSSALLPRSQRFFSSIVHSQTKPLLTALSDIDTSRVGDGYSSGWA